MHLFHRNYEVDNLFLLYYTLLQIKKHKNTKNGWREGKHVANFLFGLG